MSWRDKKVKIEKHHLLGGTLMAVPLVFGLGVGFSQGYLSYGNAAANSQWFLGTTMLLLGFGVFFMDRYKLGKEELKNEVVKEE